MIRFAFLGLVWVVVGAPANAHSPQPPMSPSTVEQGSPISFGGPFSLIDHLGRSRTDRDFRGRFLLIYFGYTACPDICPTTLAELRQLMREHANLETVALLTGASRRECNVALNALVGRTPAHALAALEARKTRQCGQ